MTMNEGNPAQPQIASLVAKIINFPPIPQALAVEDIAEKFGDAIALATLEAIANAKRAEIKAPAPPSEQPAWVAKLEPIEDWQAWLLAAVAIAIEDRGLIGQLAAEADRWGEDGGEEFKAV